MAVDKDISYALIDGIFDTLNNSVTVNAVTYPVYKSIPVFSGNYLCEDRGSDNLRGWS